MTLPDGSPSRDRLARIAAMIHDAEHAAPVRGEWETGAVRLVRLVPLVPRVRRARQRAAVAAVVDHAG